VVPIAFADNIERDQLGKLADGLGNTAYAAYLRRVLSDGGRFTFSSLTRKHYACSCTRSAGLA
jgi:hypothetical protein